MAKYIIFIYIIVTEFYNELHLIMIKFSLEVEVFQNKLDADVICLVQSILRNVWSS